LHRNHGAPPLAGPSIRGTDQPTVAAATASRERQVPLPAPFLAYRTLNARGKLSPILSRGALDNRDFTDPLSSPERAVTASKPCPQDQRHYQAMAPGARPACGAKILPPVRQGRPRMKVHNNSPEAVAYLRDALARAERELVAFYKAVKEHGLRFRSMIAGGNMQDVTGDQRNRLVDIIAEYRRVLET